MAITANTPWEDTFLPRLDAVRAKHLKEFQAERRAKMARLEELKKKWEENWFVCFIKQWIP